MSRMIIPARWTLAAGFILAVAIVLAACGGGSGGGAASGFPAVVSTSFQGFPAAPGGGLPPIFRDEVLLLTVDRSIDTNILGGLVTDSMGQPQVFVGFSSTNSMGVPYHAFVDQAAAQQAFQVLDDALGGAATPYQGILGVSAVNPNVIVFDPKVPLSNPFGLPLSLGLAANTQYDIFIPANSALTAGGTSVGPYGAPPPQTIPAFTPSPGPGTVFVSGPGFAPDTIPPMVVDITTQFLSQNGLTVADPIPHDDTIIVTFSEPVDPATIDRQKNLLILNSSVVTSTAPNGVIVPVTQVSDLTGTVYSFTPTSFGSGPYQIRVEVGTNTNPADAIKDLPSGATGTQNSLANSLIVTFTTQSAPGQLTSASIGEVFETTAQQDTSFSPRYPLAEWNQPVPPLNAPSGQLRGQAVSGTFFFPNLGTRQQFGFQPNGQVPMNPTSCNTPTCVYNAPFDTDVQNLSTMANPVNPMGGSHLMHLYLTNGNELPNDLADTIELYEWGAPSGSASPISYPGFKMQFSHTTAQGTPMASGLTAPYVVNFDFDNPQNEWIMPFSHPNPMNMNLNEAPVLVVPTTTYVVGQFTLVGTFIPFPPLVLPFDYDDNRQQTSVITGTTVNPNLVVDIDIPPPVIEMNNMRNVIVGANANSPTPTRRLLGASLLQPGTMGLPAAQDAAIYHSRFTTVNKNSSALTLFYDLGSATVNPDYLNLDVFPPVANRPAGTFITIRVEGADAVNGANVVGSTGTLTYVTRNGVVQPAQLDMLDGKRFFRVTFEFEADLTNNVVPFIEGFLLGYQF